MVLNQTPIRRGKARWREMGREKNYLRQDRSWESDRGQVGVRRMGWGLRLYQTKCNSTVSPTSINHYIVPILTRKRKPSTIGNCVKFFYGVNIPFIYIPFKDVCSFIYFSTRLLQSNIMPFVILSPISRIGSRNLHLVGQNKTRQAEGTLAAYLNLR